MLQLDFVAPNLTATLEGEIDHHSSQYLRNRIDEAVEATHPQRLTMDFSQVSFMDSSGIGVLLNRYKQMDASRGRAVYYGAGPQVKRILEMAGIGRLMNGYATREEALNG